MTIVLLGKYHMVILCDIIQKQKMIGVLTRSELRSVGSIVIAGRIDCCGESSEQYHE